MANESKYDGHHHDRELAYYNWRLSTFSENRMTHDKTVLQLSSAGIGLIATLLTAFRDQIQSYTIGPLFLVSAFGFGITIWWVLRVFRLNSDSLKTEDSNQHEQLNLQMQGVDESIQWSFGGAIAFLFLAGASLLFQR